MIKWFFENWIEIVAVTTGLAHFFIYKAKYLVLAVWHNLIGFIPVCFFLHKNICRHAASGLLCNNGYLRMASLGTY